MSVYQYIYLTYACIYKDVFLSRHIPTDVCMHIYSLCTEYTGFVNAEVQD